MSTLGFAYFILSRSPGSAGESDGNGGTLRLDVDARLGRRHDDVRRNRDRVGLIRIDPKPGPVRVHDRRASCPLASIDGGEQTFAYRDPHRAPPRGRNA